jgi:hypothetical protein
MFLHVPLLLSQHEENPSAESWHLMEFGLQGLDSGALDGWASAILSGIAILVGIWVAYLALSQAGKIAKSQAALELTISGRQNTMEMESYLSGRMQGLIDHARATLLEARTIFDLADPRTFELLSFPEADSDLVSTRRIEVLSSLSRLQTEVELLRAFAITMPAIGSISGDARQALYKLMDEGAWLYSEAFHLSILAFEDTPEDDVDLSDHQAVIDALLNGSLVNLPRRLLSDLIDKDPDNVPYLGQPGSPWDSIYARRKKVLLESGVAKPSKFLNSLTQFAASSLHHTLDRFQDALIAVLRQWNASKEG